MKLIYAPRQQKKTAFFERHGGKGGREGGGGSTAPPQLTGSEPGWGLRGWPGSRDSPADPLRAAAGPGAAAAGLGPAGQGERPERSGAGGDGAAGPGRAGQGRAGQSRGSPREWPGRGATAKGQVWETSPRAVSAVWLPVRVVWKCCWWHSDTGRHTVTSQLPCRGKWELRARTGCGTFPAFPAWWRWGHSRRCPGWCATPYPRSSPFMGRSHRLLLKALPVSN